jgi:hypothetical protein
MYRRSTALGRYGACAQLGTEGFEEALDSDLLDLRDRLSVEPS